MEASDQANEDLTSLRTLIEGSDLESIKILLSHYTTEQIRAELERIIAGENHISFALRLGHKKIATELLIRSIVGLDQWSYNYEEFSWLKLFETVDKRETISQLKDIMKYAEAFAKKGLIDLESLLARPKFVKVAILLGARPKDEKSFGKKILGSNLGADARQLFIWLVQSGICNKFPLPQEEMITHFKASHKFFLDALKSHPNWMSEQDDDGNNIFHLVLKKKVRQKNGPIWRNLFALGLTDREALINAVIQQNKIKEIPALLYFKRKYPRSYPNEFLIGLKRLIDTNQMEALQQFFYKEASIIKGSKAATLVAICFYLLQCGFAPDSGGNLAWVIDRQISAGFPFHKLFHSKCLGKNFRIPKKKKKKSKKSTELTRIEPLMTEEETGLKYCYLLEMPQEILHIIIANLSLGAMNTLFSCNKMLNELFKELINTADTLWQGIFPSKYVRTTYQRTMGQYINLRSHWYHNKYIDIELPSKYLAITMDEHWLLLHDNRHYHYWNCHSQELTPTSVPAVKHHTHVMMNNYHKYSGPTVLNAKEWTIIRGNETFVLNNITENMRTRLRVSKVTPIDHKMLVSSYTEKFLYDIEKDAILYSLPDKFNTHYMHAVYNPFREVVILFSDNTSSSEKYILDPRSKQIVPISEGKAKSNRIPRFQNCVFTDENTAFFTEPKYQLIGAGFIDMRTLQPIYSATNLLSISGAQIFTSDRVIFTAHDAPIMSSWNVSSQKIEWMEVIEEYCPVAANARYLVGTKLSGSQAGVFIRDYSM